MSTRDAAHYALKCSYSPIPIPRGAKSPVFSEWTQARYDHDDIATLFEDEPNIGILLGQPSDGLIDVDLDTPEAVELAGRLLPETSMIHGRPSALCSHFWYQVPIGECPATAKYVDPTDRASLVELRSTGSQTIVPPSIHPSGEKLRWLEPHRNEVWSVPPSIGTSGDELSGCVAALAAATLLTRHWPGEGSRHDAAVALCGGLLRGGWGIRLTKEFVALVAQVSGDEEHQQRKADAETTQRRLAHDGQIQGWPTLSKLLGKEVVDAVIAWLQLKTERADDNEESEDIPNRRLVGKAIREGVDNPEQIVPGVLYTGMIHWWQGPPEGGKSLLLLSIMSSLVHQGYTVMWIDEETGLATTADRLSRMGADPDTLDEKFWYYESPGLAMNQDNRERLALSLNRAKPDVVVMDSCSDMLAQAGLDEDSNSNITDWYHSFVTPLTQHGATVVIIDHVTKARDSRGTYARGAGAKKAKADVAWGVNVEERFALDPPRLGRIALTINKDRLGRLPGRVTYSIGATSDGHTRVRRLNGGTRVVSARERIRTNITNMLLERTGDPDNAMSTSEVSQVIEGKDVVIRQVLNELEQDEESPVTYYTQTASETATKYWWAEDSSSVIEVDFS
jgi:archaellum biogenesis ATPase FlaH